MTPARYPYGPRPAALKSDVLAHEIVDYLVEVEQVKMVVIACNTAASVALEDLASALFGSGDRGH